MKGTYLILFHIEQPVVDLQIGKLGYFRFDAGTYLYVGSAFGPGGIPARLKHHQRHDKPRPHWHLDYLRPYARLCETWSIMCPIRLEQQWCTVLSKTFAMPIPHFGASDSQCATHLFYSPTPPSIHAISMPLFEGMLSSSNEFDSFRLEIHRYDDKP